MALLQDQDDFQIDQARRSRKRTVTLSVTGLVVLGVVVILLAVGGVLFGNNIGSVIKHTNTNVDPKVKKLADQLQQSPDQVIPQTLQKIKDSTDASDFDLLIVPKDKSTKANSSVTYEINLIRGASFSDTLRFSVEGLPSSVTSTFDPTTLSGSKLTTKMVLTIPNATPLGSYTFTITAQGGGKSHQATGTLTVTNIAANAIQASAVRAMETGTKWQATVTWTTDVPANSWVEYTPNSSYISDRQSYLFTSADQGAASNHQITLYYLDPDTVYHFRIKSIDQLSNIIVSDDSYFVTKAQ